MKTIAYCRVSTTKQADSGLGLDAQLASIATYSQSLGLNLSQTFTDAAISGASPIEKRPGLTAAIASLKRGDLLIIAKRDRLGRDQFVTLTIERAVAKRGAKIVCADGIANGETTADDFLRKILDAAAQFERGLVKARTLAAMQQKRLKNESCGEVPFGYQLIEDGKLIECEKEQAVIRHIIICRERGISFREIAKIMNDAKHPTKKGGAWMHTSVVSILKRQNQLTK